jgi:hypothetical protein
LPASVLAPANIHGVINVADEVNMFALNAKFKGEWGWIVPIQ